MAEPARKPLEFYIGSISDYCKSLKRGKGGNVLLFCFMDLFDNPDDRYYAANLFDEKPKLIITPATEVDFLLCVNRVYDSQKPVYNLHVKDDLTFFLDTLAPLDYLKGFCRYYGFEYELDESCGEV